MCASDWQTPESTRSQDTPYGERWAVSKGHLEMSKVGIATSITIIMLSIIQNLIDFETTATHKFHI